MISEATFNQLKWSEKYNKQIGIRKDYRSGISDNEFPIYLKVEGNEEYWEQLEEITINQGEFNSVGLSFMHFMSPELNYKTNPYKVMKIWVDIGDEENKEQMYGVQQVYQDSIRCKLIGTPEQIEGVKAQKKFEENISWQDELERIREYSINEIYRDRKPITITRNGVEYEISGVDDYAAEEYVADSWKNYGRQYKHIRRLRYLEDQLAIIEDKLWELTEIEKQIYEIMAKEYGVTKYTIDEKYLLVEDSNKISKKFETHPAEVWKAFYVYIESYVKREIKWLEDKL